MVSFGINMYETEENKQSYQEEEAKLFDFSKEVSTGSGAFWLSSELLGKSVS